MARRQQFILLQLIRDFFNERGFLDVLTPPAVENPGMEVHIHPFALQSARTGKSNGLYLHTSPEFCLKELIATEPGMEKIFSLSYCFRDEPSSPIHRLQFLMLEWYRQNEHYERIMHDVSELIEYCCREGEKKGLPLRSSIKSSTMVKRTMQELFQEFLGIDILEALTTSSLKELLKKFPDVPVPATDLEWDDYFFLLYLNRIEPHLAQRYPLLMVTEFPAPLSALSTLKEEDPRVCERFEVYINGVELCNCFNELTNAEEQRRRFREQAELKRRLYGYTLPEPKKFYHALDHGLPKSAGIALGVERLLHSLFEIENPFFY